MLNHREIKIAHKLLTTKGVIRIEDLSNYLSVSTRTIKYDLDNIKLFFDKHNINLKTKPGKGVWIDHSSVNHVMDVLNILVKSNQTLFYNQNTRLQIILFELFTKNKFITAEQLSNLLFCSRSTILKDIKLIGDMLGNNFLSKHGKGYILQGEEAQIRTFFEDHIRKSLTGYDIYNIVESIKSNKRVNLNIIQFNEYYPDLENIVSKIQAVHPKNVITIVTRLFISISRVKINKLIGSSKEAKNLSGNYDYECYSLAFRKLGLKSYIDEIYYINGEFSKSGVYLDFSTLALKIINETSALERFPYYKDVTLHTRLVSHLSQSFNEVNSENPFNALLIQQYSTLFNTVKDVCHNNINNKSLLTTSFIGYIALHFLVSKKNILDSKKLKAILICASGRGAVKLIERIIESEIKQLKVIKNCSLPEAEGIISKLNPDIIISVFPINTHLPTVIVEPIPNKDNLSQIKNICTQLQDFPYSDFDNMLNETPSSTESISQNIILIGLKVYNELITENKFKVKENLYFAFLSHIFLFSHRYTFNKQYSNTFDYHIPNISKLHEAFKKLDIQITEGELSILSNYLNLNESTSSPPL